ncbi:MAG: hypothetical protein LBF40_08135 [Deltaproteobacteria bacterium]|jgi:type IV pilus assembly protein PilY1|nr:hypothetical protein [Deltaproteobacteria bacterium]
MPSGALALDASEKANYQTSPVLAAGRTIPRVLLVISKDMKMFQQAYNELTDMDEDGRVDTGFNPAVIYYGYFDPKSCYKYSSTTINTNISENPANYFIRVGDTIEDSPQATLDAQKKSAGVADYVKAARAVHYKTGDKIGICQAPHTSSTGNFSGNWLNFATATRMDVLRKILYGGYRSVDTVKKGNTAGQTILESTFMPKDANTFGTDVLADNRWSAETPLTNYYDISKYTPFPKPAANTAHWFARTRSGIVESSSKPPFPVLQYILNGTTNYFDSYIKPTGGGRYYDWVLNDGLNPSSQHLTTTGQGMIKSYNVKVLVCDPANYAESENCRTYPSGDFKPVGLLQTNGESGQMYFGLMTGSFNDTTFRKGGVMRTHINDLTGAVDPQTGQVKSGGLIYAIDTLRISGSSVHTKASNTWNTGNSYTSAVSWGNPSGELLFEATRYFARLAQVPGETALAPSSTFVPASETSYNYKTASYLKDWKTLPSLPSGDCAKPIILFIAEEDSDFDGDDVVNSASTGLSRPVLTTYSSSVASGLPPAFNLTSYLNKITANEGLASSGRNYFYSASYSDDCRPKALTSLTQVKGMCPNNPAFEGTYTAAAVAYYAHTHNFSQSELQMPIDVYAVTMSTNFPRLYIPVLNANGTVAKQVTIIPASMSQRSAGTTHNRILGFLNYYILEWQVDPRGTPYHIKIKVNFEDAAIGYDITTVSYRNSDWDTDQLIEYEIDLLTDDSTPTSKRNTTAYNTKSTQAAGALKVGYPTKNFYSYKAQQNSPFIVEPSEVKGISVSTWKRQNSSQLDQSMGYVISGTTHDGTYMEIQHYSKGIARNATPATCNWPAGYGSTTANGTKCGVVVVNNTPHGSGDAETKKQFRNFEFDPNPSATGEFLPTPMYLAAKYGSFTDYNMNGVPDQGEWEGAGGMPRNYFQATNVSQLPTQLEAAFQDIARSITTGTATSATIDTILGGGVSIQTLYYPEYVNPVVSSERLRWVGSVFGLFVDRWGNLREDNDGDGILTTTNGPNGDKGDFILTFNSTKEQAANPPKCYDFGQTISRCYDPYGTNEQTHFTGSMLHPANVHQIKALFDTGKWLAQLDDAKLMSGSRGYNVAATTSNSQRRIYYGKPLGGGISLTLFNSDPASINDIMPLTVFDNYQDAIPGFTSKSSAAKALVEWVIGKDQPGLRSRTVGDPWSNNTTQVTWRMGDVINSKPIIVGTPASNYDLLYKDTTYTAYKTKWSTRRQMAYFGANDGMLHAINVGFYGSLANGRVSFTRQPLGQAQGTSFANHEIGAEVWAYIPTSLLPHLQWLPDPQYVHSYYVDMKPLLVDAKIGGDWRTLLVGGLRLGGRAIETPDESKAGAQFFFSELFCIDVTDPEAEPKLLWRYSAPEAGLTVGTPNFVSNGGKWYVVIPSGPRTDSVVPKSGSNQPYVSFGSQSPYNGHSSQYARLIVLDAETGLPAVDFTQPGMEDYLRAIEPNSFFNNPFLPVAQNRAPNWTNHTLYYGLTITKNAVTGVDSGAIYRLQMVDSGGSPLSVGQWKLKRLYNTDRPVTGAVNSTYDGLGNLWVVFGTGRLWSQEDVVPCHDVAPNYQTACKANHDQYIFGIKEDLDPQGRMRFTDMSQARLIDVSGARVYKGGNVSNVTAQAGITVGTGGTTQYSTLAAAIKRPENGGYKRKLDSGRIFYPAETHSYEMVITQPKLVTMGAGVSYMYFSSFEPKEAGCGESGYGFLYLVDTFTGLPTPAIFTSFYTGEGAAARPNSLAPDEVPGVISLGPGGPLTEAYVTTSHEGIKGSAARDGDEGSIVLPSDGSQLHGMTSWKEVMDYGFTMPKDKMVEGL